MFTKIVWATDGSEAADRALEGAKALALAAHGTLVVVHCKEMLTGRAGGYPVLADEDELVDKARTQADDLRAEGIDVRLELATATVSGAAHAIADVAGELGADVIVVGTCGHTPVAGLLLGSVTQRLLHIAPCPVLAVPPVKGAHVVERREEEAVVAK
ncbi:MAG TPA: universal stress protein [Gaiellaceae bacterium]